MCAMVGLDVRHEGFVQLVPIVALTSGCDAGVETFGPNWPCLELMPPWGVEVCF